MNEEDDNYYGLYVDIEEIDDYLFISVAIADIYEPGTNPDFL